MTSTANTDQFEAWNGESGQRWVANADRRDAVLAPVGHLLLEHAAIRPGEAVLDIGCGCGATTLAAATLTGSAGNVVGLDLSAPMLDVARRRAAAAGQPDVRFVHGDAQTRRLDRSFGVAISRFGTMFFADEAAAFANVARHLVPGGRLCMATWQPLAANEWLTVPGEALLDYGTMPDAASPSASMFSQSEPDAVRALLAGAGFEGIDCAPHTLSLTFGDSVDEAVAYLADTGPGRAVLDTIPDDEHDAALAAVHDVLADHHAADRGVTLHAAVWLTTATMPVSS